MYSPKYFKLEDEKMIDEIIEQHSFATLISYQNEEPIATHLPLVLDRKNGCLYGHFAKPNHQWKTHDKQTFLAIFQGPHSYISSSWYETKTAVPTWNYVTVHVYGQMELMEDSVEISNTLNDLVEKYETPNSSYSLENVDASYIEQLSKGIVAFKLHITKIEAKAKLSQNHPLERKQRVIQQLEKSTRQEDHEVAAWMKRFL